MKIKKNDLRILIREAVRARVLGEKVNMGTIKNLVGIITMFAGDEPGEGEDLLTEPDEDDGEDDAGD